MAARDSRVKALHSQVGAFDGRTMLADPKEKALAYSESTRRARGELGYPPPGVIDKAPNCAMQILIAEKEELFDNRESWDQGV